MITNNKRYFSRGIAIDKLCDAKTPNQVKAVMRKACALCQEAGKYDPRWRCYEESCIVLINKNAKLENLTPNNSRVIIRKTRKYDRKGVAKRLITLAYKQIKAHSKELALDAASVYFEMGDYENAIIALEKNGFNREAQAVKNIAKGGD